MRYLCVLVLLAGALCAQTTTITVTVTVPAGTAPIVTDWLATQCATYNADGVTCATPLYASLKAFVQQTIQTAINNQLATILQWAVATNDASIPAAVKTAITNRTAAQTTISAAQATAAVATAVAQ